MMWTYTLKKGDSVLDLTTEVTNGRVSWILIVLVITDCDVDDVDCVIFPVNR